MPVYAQILIILVLLLCNGYLAMAELAVVSSRKARLHKWADDGNKGAKLALEIANSPTEFLSTIQIGITAVGVFTGAFGGATIADRLAVHFTQFPAIEPYADAIALGIVVACITYFSLIIGELVPKRLALHSPEKIASWVAKPMRVLSQVAKPAVVFLSASTAVVLNALRIREQTEPQVTEAEIQVLVAQATDAGVFEEAEQEMIASVLKLGDTKVTALMTPRTNIVWLDVSAGESELSSVLQTTQHARFPVAEGTLDKLVGIVETKQIMRSKLRGEEIDLRSMAFQPSFVPETKTGLQLLESFRDSQQDVAIVLDEYGGIQGLVTRDDIFQSIVGDLPTAGEQNKWEAHKSDDGSWFIDGQMSIGEFKELFELVKLPGEDEDEYHTLAGFVLYKLEHVPEPGEHFDWESLRFEVVDMDRHRIDKIRLSYLPKS